ncbi:MAG: DUF5753 domain-containing protein, partial [Sciscionella sp.]
MLAQFRAVIGENALRYPPCEDGLMAAQLRHLLTWADRPNVMIRALPLDNRYSPALEGPFVLLEFERSKPVVQLEHYRSTVTLTNVRDVEDYRAATDTIRRDAMSAADTTA